MTLQQFQVQMLGRAAKELTQKDLKPYFDLKRLLPRPVGERRLEFERLFAKFYGLNAAAVSDRFKERFFERLFLANLKAKEWPDYSNLLRELHEIPTRRKKQAFPASFVSKLVATCDDSRPLYDRHVANFFGLAIPVAGSLAYRSAILVSHLEFLRSLYTEWSKQELASSLDELRTRIPDLDSCHSVRLCDFLVWTVGRKKLSDSTQ
jgi:hypothetical protein